VIIWSVTLLALLGLTLYTSGSVVQTIPADVLEDIRSTSEYWGGLMGLRPQGEALGTTEETMSQDAEDAARLGGNERVNETEIPPLWLDYKQ
jgi:hypothetical protein